jgi:hypothetical protein
MTCRSSITLSEPTLQRIRAEYLEMPGLQLSVKQAHRLWGLDEETCARSMEYLVENRFLVRTTRGLYARLTEGSIAVATLRMAKASVDRSHAAGSDTTRGPHRR